MTLTASKIEELAEENIHLTNYYRVKVEGKGRKFILWVEGMVSVGGVVVAAIAKDGSRAWVDSTATRDDGSFLFEDAILLEAILKDLGLSRSIIVEDKRLRRM